MERRAAYALLTGTVVAVLFAAIATGGEVRFADRAPALGNGPTVDVDEPVTTTPVAPPAIAAEPGPPLPWALDLVLFVVFFAAIAVVAAFGLRYRPRHSLRLRWQLSRRRRRPELEVLADVATVINADAEAQRAALLSGSPRNAIVECWLRLEHAVADAGVPPDVAETSSELTLRVLTRLRVEQKAIERLASLYREARFSDHAMGEDARLAAIEALGEIHDGVLGDVGAAAVPA